MHIDILTIFPLMFHSPLNESIIKRAQSIGLISISIHDLRNWTNDPHRTVDDRPYGGGPGMVMMVEPIEKALVDLKSRPKKSNPYIILTSAKGKTFNQVKARELSKKQHLIFIAGHYEGVDHRVVKHCIDEEISIGDYILTGGELPTMVMLDSITRLLPGVLGDAQSIVEESHSTTGYIEYPHYTRPEDYKGWKVPPVLLSGNHAAILKWRQEQSSKK